ncbi:hypothetical protein STIAU_0439 [Stigmatella aurantiaca DW4/3-1]|uniref:Uncharacterized protein n=1 Tax=Stigmatella aurantiaca (strain DW4/3-1) TaxID=378806 RepID=Q096T5_STIAD|nr:hypothetical protein STIAU_0439 [Stigmatella aurantiaca DW4/3-1]
MSPAQSAEWLGGKELGRTLAPDARLEACLHTG